MEELYLEIRAIHMGAVIASGSLFVLRALTQNLFNARWPTALPTRILSWTVDTVLLTAALMLMTIVQQYPFAESWLTMKLVLLVVYILVGWYAFRAQGKAMRLWSMALAIALFGFIVTIARTHNPLGLFASI